MATPTVMILIANGIDETSLTEIQRGLTRQGMKFQTVGSENGVVTAWHGNGFGHNFPVDRPIGETLGSDFDCLVIADGTRAADKLRQNPHTRRIIGHFIDAEKPVAACGAGVGLLALAGRLEGFHLSAPAHTHLELQALGARMEHDPVTQHSKTLTNDGTHVSEWVETTLSFFATAQEDPVAAAA